MRCMSLLARSGVEQVFVWLSVVRGLVGLFGEVVGFVGVIWRLTSVF
jgi:hypothetical protein